jgi:hypothetical protein
MCRPNCSRVSSSFCSISQTSRDLPSSSAFWIGADNGVSELNLGGWQFQYRIEHLERRILVVAARQLGSQARSS